ncbi:MAG: hypothetical protein AAGE59_07235 [Cyanobacteria bacterium P01_F01_bin.86]
MSTPTVVTQSALHITTKILPGNKLEIQLPPDAIVGGEVDVFIVLPKPNEDPQAQDDSCQLDVLEIIEEGRRHRIGMTAQQIDEHLRAERDSWER